jgi:hypothetical protein
LTTYRELSPIVTDSETGLTVRYPGKKIIEPDPTDVLTPIPGHLAHRPDLLSKHYYRSTEYDWVIPMVNAMIDPVAETTEGRIVAVPVKARVFALSEVQS